MREGAVAGDALREGHSVGGPQALEQVFHSPVHVPQTRRHLQNRLAHHRETEVPGFNHARVHRTHRYLVHPRALDLDEGVGCGVAEGCRHRARPAT